MFGVFFFYFVPFSVIVVFMVGKLRKSRAIGGSKTMVSISLECNHVRVKGAW